MSERLITEVKRVIEGSEPYPGYPETRYVVDPKTAPLEAALNIPSGPWDTEDSDLPTSEQSQQFIDEGYRVDLQGRPLHPWLLEMVTDPNIGVVGGKGHYWNWGPNRTADPIVITRTAQPRVLLIKRGDTGAWALPGGFVDDTDPDVLTAARRELQEEAGLLLETAATEVYSGVVADRRTTAHAWAETGAFLMQLDRQVLVSGHDDAVDAMWARLDTLDERLFGSHNFLIKEAVPLAEFQQKKSIADILAIPKEDLAVEVINAGHMAYNHLFVSNEDSRLFVKEHDAQRFTDPVREIHSRAYLQKEYALYEHVAERGFGFIPDRVDLVDDTLLAMDALTKDEGWHWDAPQDQIDAYTKDVLGAFSQLQQVRIPNRPDYHEHISPTYETFWMEGWDAITDEKSKSLIQKITALSKDWNDQQRSSVQSLIKDLPILKEHARFIDRDPQLFMAHNDARQSNIAWHPEHGARIVDWSWGDPAPKNADSTMFLIDLVKSGYDVSPYIDHVNKDQVIVLIGFWLAHSMWLTRDGSSTVREQQLASASAAHRLLDLLA